MDPTEPSAWTAIDSERRFGGLRRLYGARGYEAVRRLRVVVVGIGGVGSWAVEALGRSGVAQLCLIDLDHVAESNVNRQVHADSGTLGQAKVQAMAARLALIHPECQVHAVDAFVEPDNWPGLLPWEPDAVIDACDQMGAKLAMAAWALRAPQVCFVTCGAAGGKRDGHRTEIADLAEATHDPLLARLRSRLRKDGLAPRAGRLTGVTAVFSRETVSRDASSVCDADAATDHSLNCHGYGSTVTVTAAFGLAAAGQVLNRCAQAA